MLRNERIKVGGKPHAFGGVARRLVDIDNVLVGGSRGIERKMHFANDFLICSGLAEGFARQRVGA